MCRRFQLLLLNVPWTPPVAISANPHLTLNIYEIARAVSCPGPLFSIQVPARRKKNREKQMINASQCLVANLRHRVEK
jgi:hypothetical protein